MTDLIILDKPIREVDGLFCLNDLHKASGGLSHKKPSEWLKQVQVIELIKELELEIPKDGIPSLEQNQQVIKTIKGGNRAGTFACRELVLAYATWIAPRFFLLVLRTFDLVNKQAMQPTLSYHAVAPVSCFRVPRSPEEADALRVQLEKEQRDLAVEQRVLALKMSRAEPWFRFWADLNAENHGFAALPYGAKSP